MVDAIGGMVKSHARRRILSRKAHILKADNLLAECAEMNICFLSYTDEEVQTKKELYDENRMRNTGKAR